MIDIDSVFNLQPITDFTGVYQDLPSKITEIQATKFIDQTTRYVIGQAEFAAYQFEENVFIRVFTFSPDQSDQNIAKIVADHLFPVLIEQGLEALPSPPSGFGLGDHEKHVEAWFSIPLTQIAEAGSLGKKLTDAAQQITTQTAEAANGRGRILVTMAYIRDDNKIDAKIADILRAAYIIYSEKNGHILRISDLPKGEAQSVANEIGRLEEDFISKHDGKLTVDSDEGTIVATGLNARIGASFLTGKLLCLDYIGSKKAENTHWDRSR